MAVVTQVRVYVNSRRLVLKVRVVKVNRQVLGRGELLRVDVRPVVDTLTLLAEDAVQVDAVVVTIDVSVNNGVGVQLGRKIDEHVLADLCVSQRLCD